MMKKDSRNLGSGRISHNRSKPKQSISLSAGGIAVIVIFSVCIIVFMAKGIFFSGDTELPAGIDTATINTNQTTPAVEANAQASDAQQNSISEDSISVTETEASQAEESSNTQENETVFVNQYAYLHTEPDKDAENIVCMSPNIEVTVLEKLENGYWKVTFMNIDGQKTGYVWHEYVQSTPLS